MLALRREATVELCEGELWPGVSMLPSEARIVAHKILLLVAEIEHGLPPPE